MEASKSTLLRCKTAVSARSTTSPSPRLDVKSGIRAGCAGAGAPAEEAISISLLVTAGGATSVPFDTLRSTTAGIGAVETGPLPVPPNALIAVVLLEGEFLGFGNAADPCARPKVSASSCKFQSRGATTGGREPDNTDSGPRGFSRKGTGGPRFESIGARGGAESSGLAPLWRSTRGDQEGFRVGLFAVTPPLLPGPLGPLFTYSGAVLRLAAGDRKP